MANAIVEYAYENKLYCVLIPLLLSVSFALSRSNSQHGITNSYSYHAQNH